MNITHHGGKHTVTGSCHELNLNGGSVLIDCGLVQGKSPKSLNVVAASGMCEGGRVMDYLKALLPDKRTDVIFAGYQSAALSLKSL